MPGHKLQQDCMIVPQMNRFHQRKKLSIELPERQSPQGALGVTKEAARVLQSGGGVGPANEREPVDAHQGGSEPKLTLTGLHQPRGTDTS